MTTATAHPYAPQMITAYTEIMETFLYTQRDVLKSVLFGGASLPTDFVEKLADLNGEGLVASRELVAPVAASAPPMPIVARAAPNQ